MVNRTVIRLKNAVFYAYHGVGEGEQKLGGKFECDVEIHGDFSRAAARDALEKTVDYERVYAFIQAVVMDKRYYLLEALASTIAGGLLREFYNIEEVLVRVRKPHPPVRGVVDYVEVEVTHHR
jgi:dihydroneopterin aldolase